MSQREDQFTRIETFSVFVGTWNVNGQTPSESLEQWLADDDEAPDLCVIGFQVQCYLYLPVELFSRR